MRRCLAAGAIVLLAVAASGAQPLNVPPLTGRVVDRADVLSPSTEAALTARLAAHQDSTSNQIVVLTISSLGGEILERYATRVFRAWGLGQAGTDNGILLLVSRDDRQLRIEVGYGLEGDLTDALSGRIIRNEIVPRFRDGDYNGGVTAGVDAVLLATAGAYQPSEPASLAREVFLVIGSIVGLVAVMGLVVGSVSAVSYGSAGESVMGTAFGLVVTGGMIVYGAFNGVPWRWAAALFAVIALTSLYFLWLNRWAESHPRWGPKRRTHRAKQKAFATARERGDPTVIVEGRSYRVPARSWSSSGSGGSSFSGGGGSSGGGGASGSW